MRRPRRVRSVRRRRPERRRPSGRARSAGVRCPPPGARLGGLGSGGVLDRRTQAAAGHDDVVDDAVVARLVRRHVAVTVDVGRDLLQGPAAVVGDDLGHAPGQREDLAQLDLHVRGCAPGTGGPLVDHDAGIGKSEALPGRAAAEDHGGRRHAHAHADGGDVGLDVLHHVVDGHAGVGDAARGVDVEGDVLLVVLGLEEQHLRNDQVGHLVVDLLAQEDDALPEQLRVDVEGAVAPASLLDDRRDQDMGWLRRRRWSACVAFLHLPVPRRGRAPGGAAGGTRPHCQDISNVR